MILRGLLRGGLRGTRSKRTIRRAADFAEGVDPNVVLSWRREVTRARGPGIYYFLLSIY
jgi:hypothetical protein